MYGFLISPLWQLYSIPLSWLVMSSALPEMSRPCIVTERCISGSGRWAPGCCRRRSWSIWKFIVGRWLPGAGWTTRRNWCGMSMPGRWSRIGRRLTIVPGSRDRTCSCRLITGSIRWAMNMFLHRRRLSRFLPLSLRQCRPLRWGMTFCFGCRWWGWNMSLLLGTGCMVGCS